MSRQFLIATFAIIYVMSKFFALNVSFNAVLHQTDKDGEVSPVGFYSWKLTPDEEHYSTYDRELVGLCDSCLHCRYQLLGVPFTVHTDHSSLRWILSQPDLTGILHDGLLSLVNFR